MTIGSLTKESIGAGIRRREGRKKVGIYRRKGEGKGRKMENSEGRGDAEEAACRERRSGMKGCREERFLPSQIPTRERKQGNTHAQTHSLSLSCQQ